MIPPPKEPTTANSTGSALYRQQAAQCRRLAKLVFDGLVREELLRYAGELDLRAETAVEREPINPDPQQSRDSALGRTAAFLDQSPHVAEVPAPEIPAA
jgi:hypothetical protein